MNINVFNHKQGKTFKAFQMDDYYLWDCSVIKAQGQYHMFSSRWKKELGFGVNWVFNSEIIHSVSDTPEGPYVFKNVVLPARGKEYFDGMNTHNTCIKEYKGKYYLYYMGTTYNDERPKVGEIITNERYLEVWNNKRIGLAVSDDINGEFKRMDTPILNPRSNNFWDCTVTTNPSVAIMLDGKTYMIYKSRKSEKHPMQLGVAVADKPNGEFKRLSDEPAIKIGNPPMQIEDPFLWYDNNKNRFCLLAKDCPEIGEMGITDEWGAGIYAESNDCKIFNLSDSPKAYSRNILWNNGKKETVCNLERPSLLFDENGNPTHLFCASGSGKKPWDFQNRTYIVCIKLE